MAVMQTASSLSPAAPSGPRPLPSSTSIWPPPLLRPPRRRTWHLPRPEPAVLGNYALHAHTEGPDATDSRWATPRALHRPAPGGPGPVVATPADASMARIGPLELVSASCVRMAAAAASPETLTVKLTSVS